MWTTTQYTANNTHKSIKTTQVDDKTSLGVFPAKNRSQSIKPAVKIGLLNDQSKEIATQLQY